MHITFSQIYALIKDYAKAIVLLLEKIGIIESKKDKDNDSR